MLKSLTQVPFNLIEMNQNHEFIINQEITTSLVRVESYFASLRSTLDTNRGIERISGATEIDDDVSGLLERD